MVAYSEELEHLSSWPWFVPPVVMTGRNRACERTKEDASGVQFTIESKTNSTAFWGAVNTGTKTNYVINGKIMDLSLRRTFSTAATSYSAKFSATSSPSSSCLVEEKLVTRCPRLLESAARAEMVKQRDKVLKTLDEMLSSDKTE